MVPMRGRSAASRRCGCGCKRPSRTGGAWPPRPWGPWTPSWTPRRRQQRRRRAHAVTRPAARRRHPDGGACGRGWSTRIKGASWAAAGATAGAGRRCRSRACRRATGERSGAAEHAQSARRERRRVFWGMDTYGGTYLPVHSCPKGQL